jgi:hypothetical protein
LVDLEKFEESILFPTLGPTSYSERTLDAHITMFGFDKEIPEEPEHLAVVRTSEGPRKISKLYYPRADFGFHLSKRDLELMLQLSGFDCADYTSMVPDLPYDPGMQDFKGKLEGAPAEIALKAADHDLTLSFQESKGMSPLSPSLLEEIFIDISIGVTALMERFTGWTLRYYENAPELIQKRDWGLPNKYRNVDVMLWTKDSQDKDSQEIQLVVCLGTNSWLTVSSMLFPVLPYISAP